VAVQRPIPGPGAFSGHRVIQADRGQLTLSGPGITPVKVIDADVRFPRFFVFQRQRFMPRFVVPAESRSSRA
jgi:hypothetical protein